MLSRRRATLAEPAVVPRNRTTHTALLAVALLTASHTALDMMYVLPAPDLPHTTNACPPRPARTYSLTRSSTRAAVGVSWNLSARARAKAR
eukprot:2094038-Rhodomonas_salina.1